MTKQLSLLILILSFGLCSYGQSYIGFSGGYTNPLAYESISKNSGNFQVNNIESKSGFYFSSHIQGRSEKKINLGLKLSMSNLKINYGDYSASPGGGQRRNVEYDSYIFHTQIAFETQITKDVFYFSFGPEIAIPFYSSKKESGSRWTVESPLTEYSSTDKNSDGKTNLRVFAAFNFEKPISKKMKFILNAQSSYNIWSMYEGIKTLDFRIGAGIQFSISSFQWPKGEPYILKKK